MLKRDAVGWYKSRLFDVLTISALAFDMIASKAKFVGTTSLCEIDKIIERKKAEEMMPDDEPDLVEAARRVVPIEYHEFLNVFSKAKSNELLPEGKANHRIEVDPDVKLEDAVGYSPLYKMTVEELEACRLYI